MTIGNGVLKVVPIEKATPPEALTSRLCAMLSRIRITDLQTEVAGCTGFPDCITHLRTGEVEADVRFRRTGGRA